MARPLFDYFDIKFSDSKGVDENGREYAIGYLSFGREGKLEPLAAYLQAWDEARYIGQWKEGVRRILSPSHGTSCLVVSVQPPEYAHAIECWEMHKEDGRIIFRYVIHAPILAGETRILDPDEIYDEILPRDEHEGASEWHVTTGALADFLNRHMQ